MSDYTLRAELAAVREVLERFVHPQFVSMFTIDTVHGVPYNGPTFQLELEETRTALQSHRRTENA